MTRYNLCVSSSYCSFLLSRRLKIALTDSRSTNCICNMWCDQVARKTVRRTVPVCTWRMRAKAMLPPACTPSQCAHQRSQDPTQGESGESEASSCMHFAIAAIRWNLQYTSQVCVTIQLYVLDCSRLNTYHWAAFAVLTKVGVAAFLSASLLMLQGRYTSK